MRNLDGIRAALKAIGKKKQSIYDANEWMRWGIGHSPNNKQMAAARLAAMMVIEGIEMALNAYIEREGE